MMVSWGRKASPFGEKTIFTHYAVMSSTERWDGWPNDTGEISLSPSSCNDFMRSTKAEAAVSYLGIPDRLVQSERSVQVLVVYQKLMIRTD